MATRIQTSTHVGGQGNHITFKEQTYSKDLGNATTRQLVYQGTKAALFAAAETLVIGQRDGTDQNPGYGYVIGWELKQQDSVFWNLYVNYSNQNPYAITVNMGTAEHSTTYTCVTVMKSMPLQTHQNYKYIWNHILIYLDTDNFSPSDALTADINTYTATTYIDPINRSNGHLKWIKEANQMPTEPVYETPAPTQQNRDPQPVPHYWKIAYSCTKPGVDYYQMPTYEVTQSSRSRGKPNWWKNNLPGKVADPREDFDIKQYKGGQWLCLGGQIRDDGKAYDASCTYQWTPGQWDRELYSTN